MRLQKYILIAAVVLLCLPAQADLPAADPPVELREWCHLASRNLAGTMTYLPDFDTANDGRIAIAITRTPGVRTWYFDNGCDTITNHFNWQFTARFITRVDLNNDGADDYIDGYGTLRKGIANGLPPHEDTIARYEAFGTLYPIHVADINRDGYDDVLTGNHSSAFSRTHLSVLFGGPDLRKLRLTTLRSEVVQGREEYFIDALAEVSRNSNKRIISQHYYDESNPRLVQYFLREIQVVAENADTVMLELKELDSLEDRALRPARSFEFTLGSVIRSHAAEPEFFVTPVLGANTMRAYGVAGDTFALVQEFSTKYYGPIPFALNGSLNNDEYIDWFVGSRDTMYFHAGAKNSETDSIPFAFLKLACQTSVNPTRYVIKDVSGDGIDDVAITLSGGGQGCFTIYEGVDRRTVGGIEKQSKHRICSLIMEQNYPHPASRAGTTHVPISLQTAGGIELALYTLSGRRLGLLFAGFLDAGEHRLSVDLQPYALGPGLYVLRLSDGEHRQDRGMFVE